MHIRREDLSPTVECYVDASFATHHDGKGHTGSVIMLNGSMVHASSRKQKICTKDSTEAELVGLSNNVVVVESVVALVNKLFETSVKPIVYQDNRSLVMLIENDSGKQRTKHINARIGCIKEASKDWTLKFIPTN